MTFFKQNQNMENSGIFESKITKMDTSCQTNCTHKCTSRQYPEMTCLI